ncbi:MAG: penicillin-binding protein 2, partial [bacterium]|nr:penicillin-binding protein 2 [bacterium]
MKKKSPRLRFFFLISTTTLAFLFTLTNVYHLQVGNGEFYQNKALAYNNISEAFLAKRGDILFSDKDGSAVPAAITKEYPLIYASPIEIKDPAVAASLLTRVLDLDTDALLRMLSKPGSQYVLLIPRASAEQVEAVEALSLKGIYSKTSKERLYPFDSLASQVLGFVGMDKDSDFPKGKYGIEAYYEEELSGTHQRFNESGELTASVDGEDIQLTINRDIQARAEAIIRDLAEQYGAKGATVIVQEPSTGAILAMGSYPSFNPNAYGKADVENFTNPAVQAFYEPGSIEKVITMAIGLDTGAFRPSTVYHDRGEITLNGRTIKNWDLQAYGDVTMTEGIEHSINTVLVYAESLIGHDTFYNYLNRFGFKEKTGIELPGEIVGSLAPMEDVGRDINFANAAFGQGVAVTPIRLITAVSAIANDGVMMKPYINAVRTPEVDKRVVSKKAADEVTEMMISAVEKNILAAIDHYDVAGKTGTAQVADHEFGGYKDFDEAVINTYIGFAPASNPRFTVMIKLDEPRGAPLAGETVVPAFKKLTEFLLNYYSVPP